MFYAIIPAGGSGTRLWPLSRADNPKFLHALTGTPESLLQATVARLAPLAPPDRTYVVTGATHVAGVARQLPDIPERNFLVEPSPKDSCAAIALAAAVLHERDPDAVVGSFAADQLIRDVDGFRQDVRRAIEGAEAGYLVTVGLKPSGPDTAFGYLKCGDQLPGLPVYRVAEFTEKPDAQTAEAFVRSGRYLWNASMFVFRARVLLAELARQQPAMHAAITEIAAAWHTELRDQVLARVWPTLPRIAIDYAVMEGAAAAGNVVTVPGSFDWIDVGDFDALGELLAPTESGGAVTVNQVQGSAVLTHDSAGLVVVPAGGRLVATLGITNAVIVDTPDVVFVCARDRVQDIKHLVEQMRASDLAAYL